AGREGEDEESEKQPAHGSVLVPWPNVDHDAGFGVDTNLLRADVHRVDDAVAEVLEVHLAELADCDALGSRIRIGERDRRLGEEVLAVVQRAGLVGRGLAEDGHAADVASTGEDAVWMAQAHPYDAIVLDVMLPGVSGFETCKRLRDAGVWSPVLMLTARDGVDDRVAGLDAGADDYLTKPFSFAELLARLRALARRGSAERPVELVVGDLRLDPASRRVWRGAEE